MGQSTRLIRLSQKVGTATALALIVDSSEEFGSFLIQQAQALIPAAVHIKTAEETLRHPLLSEATVVVTEALLSDLSGFDLASQLWHQWPSLPIVIMSFDEQWEVLCQENGVRFVLKSALCNPLILQQLLLDPLF